jgi:hypothetical protein
MPLKKIISIKSVGRLVNCEQKGPEFNKYNVIFAENGRGETTLCAVLRSLQTGEHQHCTERKTIAPVAAEPSAAVRLSSSLFFGQYFSNLWPFQATPTRVSLVSCCRIHYSVAKHFNILSLESA